MSRSKHVSKPTIIVFASPKGGVGKSTLCLALAAALVKQGARVRVLDVDQNQTLFSWYDRCKPDIEGLSVAAVMPDIFRETLEREYVAGHDIILIDVAGAADKVMLLAASAANLIITPARLSEPDIQQAQRVLGEVEMMTRQYQERIPHLILVNDMETLNPHYQRHLLAEITRLGLPRFATLIYRRPAYREAFMTGKPLHFAAGSRQTVGKAIEEIDALAEEVTAIINPMPMKVAVNER